MGPRSSPAGGTLLEPVRAMNVNFDLGEANGQRFDHLSERHS
jgi:hypothetical protein